MNNIAFWQMKGFQNLMNYVNSELESLHDLVMVWLVVIILVVVLVGQGVIFWKGSAFLTLDSVVLEVTWTILPIVILVSIALPSIRLLCIQDTLVSTPGVSVKLLSNQWNWQSEQNQEVFEHLLDSDKLDELGGFESPLVLPLKSAIRVVLTSSDVLHSLGIPSLGLKLDSAPGRLNAVTFEIFSPGLAFGSCYELCGSGHSAMPIYFFCL